jgi:hypothetical protein
MAAFYHACETELDQTMTLRREWEHATQDTRQLAIAADTELRRRHPRQHIEPLRSAEPRTTSNERDQLNPQPGPHHYQTPGWIAALAAERHAVRRQLTPRASNRPPSSELGHATGSWPARPGARRAAILQPPKPQIQPSRAANAQIDLGAQAESS